MANNYLQFSSALELFSSEEVSYWKNVLTAIPDLFESYWENQDTREERQKLIDHILDRFDVELSEDVFDDFPLTFSYDISDSSPEFNFQGSICFYAEENGSLGFLGEAVQSFFKKFRPNGFFYCSYAETCSKMKIDEFSGGAMVVTDNFVKFHHVTDFIRKEEKAHDLMIKNQKVK